MRTATLLIACLLISAGAFAQNNRSFVATFGNDLNNCTPGNECRSFTRAASVTNSGGEIIAVNSGGFGPFTISKSLTVAAAPGVYAAITVTSGNGVEIFAGAGSSGQVVLRGLHITLNGGTNGIDGITFKTLVIEGCTVTGGSDGVFIAGSFTSQAVVVDTTASEASAYAFEVISKTTMIRCRAQYSLGGLYVHDETGISDAIVATTDFVAAANGTGMILTCFTAGHTDSLDVDHALVAHNSQDGIVADSNQGAVNVRVNNSQVVENGGYGFDQLNSAFFGTMLNNLVAGNAFGDANGTITLIMVH